MGDKKDTAPGSLTGPCSSFSSGQAIDYRSGPSKHQPIHLACVVAADVFGIRLDVPFGKTLMLGMIEGRRRV